MSFSEMATKRKYELKKRAEQLAETRRRITEATVELHKTVGPAATQISEVARRAGALRELYAWYRETEPMTANVLRDAETIPALRAILDGGFGAYLEAVVEVLAK